MRVRGRAFESVPETRRRARNGEPPEWMGCLCWGEKAVRSGKKPVAGQARSGSRCAQPAIEIIGEIFDV